MGFSTVGDPKAAAKAGQTTAKNTTNKVAASCTDSFRNVNKQQQHSNTNRTSSKNFLEGQKRAKIGFSTVGDLKAPAAAAATKQHQSSKSSSKRTGSRSNKSKAINNSKPQKRQQKQHKQQEKNSTQQEKPASSSSKKWQKQHKKATTAVQTFWKVKSGKGVFFTTTTTAVWP